MGPNEELYLAINSGVYRLAPSGDIYRVVGEYKPLPKNYSWEGNPAVQNDFLYADRVAFDGKGDLYVAGGGGLYGLYEKASSGALRFITVPREGGTVGVLASGPNGSVIEAAGEGVLSLAPDGTTTTVATPADLQRLLGKGSGFAGGGVTTGSRGDIYFDIDASIWAGPTSALLEVHPNGTITALGAPRTAVGTRPRVHTCSARRSNPVQSTEAPNGLGAALTVDRRARRKNDPARVTPVHEVIGDM
jgi:hypothetical protein